jgi:thioester reductase-like protein
LQQLVASPYVVTVFCFIRKSSSDETASVRLASSLERNCQSELIDSVKIIPLLADLSEPDFGLSGPDFAMLKATATQIIHCAWPVNFLLPLASFSTQFAFLQNLLNFSLSVDTLQPAHLLFCSSVGAAMGTPPPATILEGPLKLTQASPTGYARSKLVAEHIVESAVKNAGANATILRIGQIMPSKHQGSQVWNPNEAIPLMVRSSVVLGMLPDEMGSGDRCAWLEADVVAKAVIDICEFEGKGRLEKTQLVYNVVQPHSFSWRCDLLPALKAAGALFEIVTYSVWLQALSQSSTDLKTNPSRKLLQFWDEQDRGDGDLKGQIVFETAQCQDASPTLTVAESVVKNRMVEVLLDLLHTS